MEFRLYPQPDVDLIVRRGTDVQILFEYLNPDNTPIDITGWTARMQIRSSEFSNTVLQELNTENNGIVIEGEDGKLTLVFTPETSDWEFSSGIYYMELYTTDDKEIPFVKGKFILERGVIE